MFFFSVAREPNSSIGGNLNFLGNEIQLFSMEDAEIKNICLVTVSPKRECLKTTGFCSHAFSFGSCGDDDDDEHDDGDG